MSDNLLRLKLSTENIQTALDVLIGIRDVSNGSCFIIDYKGVPLIQSNNPYGSYYNYTPQEWMDIFLPTGSGEQESVKDGIKDNVTVSEDKKKVVTFQEFVKQHDDLSLLLENYNISLDHFEDEFMKFTSELIQYEFAKKGSKYLE